MAQTSLKTTPMNHEWSIIKNKEKKKKKRTHHRGKLIKQESAKQNDRLNLLESPTLWGHTQEEELLDSRKNWNLQLEIKEKKNENLHLKTIKKKKTEIIGLSFKCRLKLRRCRASGYSISFGHQGIGQSVNVCRQDKLQFPLTVATL